VKPSSWSLNHRTTVCPANWLIENITCVHVPLFEHTFSTVASVVPDVLRICACCWSNVIVSVQWGLYQNDSVGLPDGTTMVWVSVLLALWAPVLPTWAAKEPVCTGVVTIVGVTPPLVVQPLNVPVSKPPLVTTVAPPVTVSDVVALWLVAELVPVTEIVEVPFGVVDEVATVIVEEPPEVIGLALKLAVAPLGRPLALRLTLVAEPDVIAVVTV